MMLITRSVQGVMRSAMAAGVTAATVNLVLGELPATVAAAAMAVLIVSSSYLPARFETAGGIGGRSISRSPGADPRTVGRGWVLFGGIGLTQAILAFGWEEAALASAPLVPHSVIEQWGGLAGAALAALVLLWAARDSRHDRLRTVGPFMPPLCVLLFITTWILGVWDRGSHLSDDTGSPWNLFASVVPVGFSAALLCALLAVGLSEEARRGSPPRFTLGISMAVVTGCFLFFAGLQ
ncbi:MAG: hypothetical protein LBD90_09010, partial [Bifidobacteriaceae bacterium]|nr:hypothetical protein [Bifidobacteriaceae bacterium]